MMRSWKTTLVGILAGVALTVGSVAQNRVTDPKAPPITAGNVIPGALLVVLGILSKDYDVSGHP